MPRLDRLQSILIQLQSKRVVRAQEIADRFNISLRTVYRDLRSLEDSGVPIGAEAGVGYYLMDNYNLPPVMFTHEEASALLIADKLIENQSDSNVCKNFESAIFKIKAILKPNQRDLLDNLHDKIAVLKTFSNEGINTSFIYQIQQAIADKEVITISYESGYKEEQTERKIEPIGLCCYASQWHVIGWCRLRSDYRDFRLDRIKRLSSTGVFFNNKKHISLNTYLKNQTTLQGEVNISIVVTKERQRFIDPTKHWYGFVSEEDLGSSVRMNFVNTELRGFAIWLLNSGCYPDIEKPVELKQHIKALIDSTNKHYAYLL